MNLFYRLMGWVAYLCGRMSRYRVNGIPSHFWILLACLTALGIGGDIQRRDAAAYGKPPLVMTLPQALAGGVRNQYVTVTGPLDSSMTIVSKGSGDQESYEPMYDPHTRQALLVQLQNSISTSPSITGMFRQVPSDLYGHLKGNGFLLGPYTISTEFQLDEGDHPVNPSSYLITVLVAGIPFALILLSVVQKHIIFQKTARSFGAAAPEQPETATMRLSGRLALGPKMTRRFLDVPVVLAETEAGTSAFVSRINASIKQADGRILDQAGLWAAVIEEGSLRVEAEGWLYLGRDIRPALRVRYTDTSTPKRIQAATVLSFETEGERAAAREKLEEATRQTA